MRDSDVELLVPYVYGTESVRRKTAQRRRWERSQLFEALAEARGAEAADFYRDLADWSEEHGAELVTGTGKNPTLNAWLPFGDDRVRVWYLGSDGALSILWNRIRGSWGQAAAERLIQDLGTIHGAAERLAGADVKGDTSLPAAILLQAGAAGRLKSALGDLVAGPRENARTLHRRQRASLRSQRRPQAATAFHTCGILRMCASSRSGSRATRGSI